MWRADGILDAGVLVYWLRAADIFESVLLYDFASPQSSAIAKHSSQGGTIESGTAKYPSFFSNSMTDVVGADAHLKRGLRCLKPDYALRPGDSIIMEAHMLLVKVSALV